MMPTDAVFVPLQLGQFVPDGTRVDVFELIFTWFVVLGTLVGIVVISYMLWNAYKFRYTDGEDKYGGRPEMGEIPTGGGKGRKLFLSFSLSAAIVVSLIAWTYGAVLYVEQPAQQIAQEQGTDDAIEIQVTGYQFGWDFTYTNYDHTQGTLVIPEGRPIALTVTSRDVFHNFGIPAFRVKTDAMPGETTESWFIADQTGTFEAKCYELCGAAHSAMRADVEVVSQSEWEQWKADNLENDNASVSAPDDGTQDSIDARIGEQPSVVTVDQLGVRGIN